MKFLCVKCDGQMLLDEVRTQESGSLSVVFACPGCGQSTAMLTNPGETQLLSSLGLKLSPANGGQKGSCPFAAMLNHGQQSTAPQAPDEPRWSEEARVRLEKIPELVRPMAKLGIERFASSRGLTLIDLEVLEAAKADFGM